MKQALRRIPTLGCRLQRTSIPNQQMRWVSGEAGTTEEPVRLYDSLSGRLLRVPHHDSNERGMACYTCGPTTYASAHLGHARTYVCLDIMRRVLEHEHRQRQATIPPPLFVMNITDVDDKIMQAAKDTGEHPTDLARRYETEFWDDLDRLNCLRPHVVTRVTEHVKSAIIPYIERLVDLEMAYVLENDGVYFDVRAFDERMETRTKYGKLAPPAQSTDFFSSREQTEVSNKRDSRDFALWKFKKNDEVLFWESLWGAGRPGWHIECSAMIHAVQDQFRDTHDFQLHTGGVDLKFPHHSNEIAQSEAYLSSSSLKEKSKEWIPHWLHTGHLHIDGLKMSKSLKNFVTIRQMLQQTDEASSPPWASTADDFRMWCLAMSGSYRGSATYSENGIQEGQRVRVKLVRFLVDCEEWLRRRRDQRQTPPSSSSSPPPPHQYSKQWNDQARHLLNLAHDVDVQSQRALATDLDGQAFLQELTRLVEAGRSYMQNSSGSDYGCEDVMRPVIAILRERLAMVGFSGTTIDAGRATLGGDGAETSSLVVGGERALLDALVSFRSQIREAAVTRASSSTNDQKDLAYRVLEICDVARDESFPALGVELRDGATAASNSNDIQYSFCQPRQPHQQQSQQQPQQSATHNHLTEVPLLDLFRGSSSSSSGSIIYQEDAYSAWDDLGVPTHHADGSELSKRQRKKLLKKRERHAQRLKHQQKDDDGKRKESKC